MCEPATIIAGITAIVSTSLTAASSAASNSAIDKSNKAQAEQIKAQQIRNRAVAIARASEARTKASTENTATAIEGAKLLGKQRVLGLTGGSARRGERDVFARVARTRQLIGLNLDSAENQARNEVRAGELSQAAQFAGLPRGTDGTLGVVGSVLQGITATADAAVDDGLIGDD